MTTSSDPTLLVAVPVERQPTQAQLTLRHLDYIRVADATLRLVSVGEDVEIDRIVASKKADHVAVSTEDVSRSGLMDACADAALAAACDALMVLRPGALPSPSYVGEVSSRIGEGINGVRILSAVYLDLQAPRAHFVPHAHPASGTTLSERALERLDYQPWQGTPIDLFLTGRLFDNIRRADLQLSAITPTADGKSQMCLTVSKESWRTYSETLRMLRGHTGANTHSLDARRYLARRFPHVEGWLDAFWTME